MAVSVSADQVAAPLLSERHTARLPALPPPPTQEEVVSAAGIGQLELLLRWLPEATASEVQSLAETMQRAIELGECSYANLSQQFWPLLFQRWFELDPQGALTFGADVREQSGSLNLKRSVEEETLYGYWAQVDPDGALESAGDTLLAVSVLKRLQVSDPWRALALSRSMKNGLAMNFVSLYANAANHDLERALESAKAISGSLLRNDVLEPILDRIAIKDPKRALGLAEALISSEEARETAIRGIISGCIARDPVSAADLLEEWVPPPQRLKMIGKLAREWAGQEGTADWIDSLETSEERLVAQVGLARGFAESPSTQEAARGLLADLGYGLPPGSPFKGVALDDSSAREMEFAAWQIAVSMAKDNRAAAMDFAAQFARPPNWERDPGIEAVLRGWIMEDALGMESYIEQAEDSTLRTKLAVYYARVGLAENERLPWAKELAGPIRDYVIQSLEIDSGRRRVGGGFFSK